MYISKQKFNKDEPINKWSIKILVLSIFCILCIGLTMLYSTTVYKDGLTIIIKQMIWIALGFSGALGIVLIGYQNLYKYKIPHLLIALSILGLTYPLLFSEPINGAYRWIKTPLGNIQPSEYAKLALILYMSMICKRNLIYLNKYFQNGSLYLHKRGFLITNIIPVVILMLIMIGKDLGTTILLFLTVWIIYFIAGITLKKLLLIPIILGVIGYCIIVNNDPERLGRLTTFLSINENIAIQQGEGYQLWNSILAFGSGNWTGVGITESMLKLKYLPEAHTDFILAIAAEELGFIGMIVIVLLYMLFLISGISISIKSLSVRGMFLGTAITLMISMQAMINLGVVTGSIPTKGMPAPMFSYGGSNMISCLLGVGILMSIAFEKLNPSFTVDDSKIKSIFIF